MKKKFVYVFVLLFLVMSFINPVVGNTQELTIPNPTFSYWGGLGELGTRTSPFEFKNSQPFPAMIGFPFPAGAANFNTVSVTITFRRLDTSQLPMKLAIKRGDINGGWAGSDNISFPQPMVNGQQTFEFTRSAFTGNVLTIGHNRDNSGDFEITVNQIRFFNK